MIWLIVVCVAFCAVIWWKACSFCHPIMEWHYYVLGPTQGLAPDGFADWKVICSCKREEWL